MKGEKLTLDEMMSSIELRKDRSTARRKLERRVGTNFETFWIYEEFAADIIMDDVIMVSQLNAEGALCYYLEDDNYHYFLDNSELPAYEYRTPLLRTGYSEHGASENELTMEMQFYLKDSVLHRATSDGPAYLADRGMFECYIENGHYTRKDGAFPWSRLSYANSKDGKKIVVKRESVVGAFKTEDQPAASVNGLPAIQELREDGSMMRTTWIDNGNGLPGRPVSLGPAVIEYFDLAHGSTIQKPRISDVKYMVGGSYPQFAQYVTDERVIRISYFPSGLIKEYCYYASDGSIMFELLPDETDKATGEQLRLDTARAVESLEQVDALFIDRI